MQQRVARLLTSTFNISKRNGALVPFILLSRNNYTVVYPMDFKMHRGGKGANPREHRERCDRGERAQPTKRQLER